MENPSICLSGPFRILDPGECPRTDISAAHYPWYMVLAASPHRRCSGAHPFRPGCPGGSASPPGAPRPPCGWRVRRAAAQAPRAAWSLPYRCRGRGRHEKEVPGFLRRKCREGLRLPPEVQCRYFPQVGAVFSRASPCASLKVVRGDNLAGPAGFLTGCPTGGRRLHSHSLP